MEVLQCPDCELRFRYATELEDHLARDHPGFHIEGRSVEDALVGAAHRHRRAVPGYPAAHRPRIDPTRTRAHGNGAKAPVVSITPRTHEGAGNQMLVTHVGGDRFSIHVRGHTVKVDQPLEAGGLDSAPTPTELYVGSLASCVAFFARRFLKRHDIPQLLEVSAQWTNAERPARVGTIRIDVDAPLVPEGKLEQFRRVVEHCTLHNTINLAPDVFIRTGATLSKVGRAS